MADIRINALATTAASTASDDFVAVDGSANGTRKLNAYSPTFGGNLTVNGTDVKINNSTGYVYVDGGSSLTGFELLRSSNAVVLYTANVERLRVNSTGLTTLAGNLTVSGTGTSDFSGNVRLANTKAIYGYTFAGATGVLISSSASDNLNVGQNNANWAALNLYGGTGNVDVYSGATGFVARFNTNGNVLLGTTTDSGNGKLQLATHTSNTGGIGFGTDTALYRYGGGILGIDHIGGSVPGLTLLANGTRIISIYGASNSLYLDTFNAAGAMYLRTGAQTTALTLDSSQQAKFSSAVYCNTTTQSSGVAGAKLITKQTSGTNDWTVTLDGNPDGVAGASYGLRILAGTNSSDYSLYIRNQTNTTTLLAVKGSGRVNMGALPTSSTGLSAGDIWNDAGTLKIV